jgi:hypothetical protein
MLSVDDLHRWFNQAQRTGHRYITVYKDWDGVYPVYSKNAAEYHTQCAVRAVLYKRAVDLDLDTDGRKGFFDVTLDLKTQQLSGGISPPLKPRMSRRFMNLAPE